MHEVHVKIFDHAHFLLKLPPSCIDKAHGQEFLGYIAREERIVSQTDSSQERVHTQLNNCIFKTKDSYTSTMTTRTRGIICQFFYLQTFALMTNRDVMRYQLDAYLIQITHYSPGRFQNAKSLSILGNKLVFSQIKHFTTQGINWSTLVHKSIHSTCSYNYLDYVLLQFIWQCNNTWRLQR